LTDEVDAALVVRSDPTPGVARITLNRPRQRNAQNVRLLYELDAAFVSAVRDDGVRCILLDAAGEDFSAGHDLKGGFADTAEFLRGRQAASMNGGFDEPGAAGLYAVEQEAYFELVKRIRNLPKPTIAVVQGRCIAGGLMLAWACDLILAADDATFMDPVVTFGMPGVEWFAHPYELGIRKAKQHLFTADGWSAQEAHAFGMVNEVFPGDMLANAALEMACKIATKPMFALKLVKEAINRVADAPGLTGSIEAYLPLHHLAHQHNFRLHGVSMDPTHVPPMARMRRTPAVES